MPLWGRERRQIDSNPPLRGCVFAEDFDSHRETTIPTIKTWLPRRSIVRELRNPQGHVIEHKFSNGSLVHYRTYDQGSDKAEGKDWDVVWFDEPPPRSYYTAVYRGLVAKDGLMLLTATLVKEAWVYDEKELPAVACFEGTIHDNPWLPEQAKIDFLNSLDDDEKSVREFGKPTGLSGVVYKEFKDGEPFVIPTDLVPEKAPIILGVDPHERRPLYLMYGYITPFDEIIFFKHAFASGALSDVFAKLESLDQENGREPAIVLMDPNRGKAIQMGGKCWEDEFINHGYKVMLGEDDIFMGHKQVRENFKYNPKDPTSLPNFRFMENLRGKGGPISQLCRYSWEDWATRNKHDRAQKEKPKDSNKDFPDIIRYIAMASLTYDGLYYGPKVLDNVPIRERSEHTLRAY